PRRRRYARDDYNTRLRRTSGYTKGGENMIQALLVDDEPMHLQGLARHVRWESLGYAKPLTAMSGDAALAVMRDRPVDVLVTDVSMLGMHVIELVACCKEQNPG